MAARGKRLSAARGQRFAAAMGAIVRRLPFGLARVVRPSLLGYAIINSCTFALDLTLLTIFHGVLRWQVPAAITLPYATASGLSYALNRVLNFRSHAAVGPQVGVYVAMRWLVFRDTRRGAPARGQGG
jgi:hypothetical protein